MFTPQLILHCFIAMGVAGHTYAPANVYVNFLPSKCDIPAVLATPHALHVRHEINYGETRISFSRVDRHRGC